MLTERFIEGVRTILQDGGDCFQVVQEDGKTLEVSRGVDPNFYQTEDHWFEREHIARQFPDAWCLARTQKDLIEM